MNKRMIPTVKHFFINIPPLMKIKYPSLYKIFLPMYRYLGVQIIFSVPWHVSPGKIGK
jgi:hypothetical protein